MVSSPEDGVGIRLEFFDDDEEMNPSSFNIISNNTIRNSVYGIDIVKSHHNIIRFNEITDCERGILAREGASENKVFCNSITGCTVLATDASDNDGILFDLTNNWWGLASGPDQDSGKGVSEGAEFKPWLREWQNFPEDYEPPEVVLVTIHDEEFKDALISQEGERISFGTQYGMKAYYWISSLDGVLHSGEGNQFWCSNLSVGTHNISVRVQDDYGVWSRDRHTGPLIVYEKVPEKKKDEVGFIPGFEMALTALALLVVTIFRNGKGDQKCCPDKL